MAKDTIWDYVQRNPTTPLSAATNPPLYPRNTGVSEESISGEKSGFALVFGGSQSYPEGAF
jgi:hypothetical protein